MPKRHSTKLDDDVKPYLITAYEINQQYYFDGFMAMIVKGRQRIGKSSYTCQAIAQAFGQWTMKPKYYCEKSDFESVKKWTVYLPRDFLKSVLSVTEKQRVIFWDDAGVWLFSLDWYQPFVKQVAKYMQVIATKFGTVILTTPSTTLISQKVIDALPEVKLAEVAENFEKAQDSRFHRHRIVRVYEKWDWADGSKGGVKSKWDDLFDAMLPQAFYDWYYPKRRSYLEQAESMLKRQVSLMEKRFEQLPKQEQEVILEDIYKVVGDPDKQKEVNEVLKMLETEQEATIQ